MAHLHQCNIFEVDKKDILNLLSEDKANEFIDWVREKATVIRFPWGDKGYSLESWVTYEDDFNAQKEVFIDCSLEFQNVIYKLKGLGKENKSELVFKP